MLSFDHVSLHAIRDATAKLRAWCPHRNAWRKNTSRPRIGLRPRTWAGLAPWPWCASGR